MSFEINQGQADGQVKFISRGNNYSLFLAATEASLTLRKDDGRKAPKVKDEWQTYASSPSTLRLKLIGANPSPRVAGLDELPGRVNYFIGHDPAAWRTNVPTYARVKYEDVYPGVDLIYYGNGRELEYDFVVAPGFDPRVIELDFDGAEELEIDARGDLIVQTAGGQIRQRRPVVYQEVDGVRREISGHYVLRGARHVSFQLDNYDPGRSLVIDPVLVYSTYLGGSGDENSLASGDLSSAAIAVDADGAAYVTGNTTSTNFPTANPMQPATGGGPDAFVAKLNAAGSALVYCTYLGGSSIERGFDIAVDAAGNAYLTGRTQSPNFPRVNPVQQVLRGFEDAFVAKLNAAGSALIFSTYLGGSGGDDGHSIALDGDGNIYVTGGTASTDFPTANPLQQAYGGGNVDAFVAKLNAAGSALVYSTYLGGNNTDHPEGIAVDASGNAYVTGNTNSTNFPTANPLRPALSGPLDAFVTMLNAAGNALAYSTYFGGSNLESGYSIAVDAGGNAYVVGGTSSTDFPTVNPLQQAFGGNVDVFVTKLNATGSALVFSTYLGGGNQDIGHSIAVDAAGNAYLTGTTTSTNFPIARASQAAISGVRDAIVVKLNSAGSALVYSSYLGGSGLDYGYGITVGAAGNAYVTGRTSSTNLPIANPLQSTYGGGPQDAFITKVSADERGTAVACVSAASYLGPTLASESIVAAFGSGLAAAALAATATPLPTSLAGTTVKVTDSAGTERLAPLFFVSPDQINFQIPQETLAGTATVTVTNNDAGVALGTATITTVAPGLFSANANGQGVAAAVALRIKADGTQSFEPIARLDTTLNPPRFVAVLLDLGPESDQVFLILFGAGIRFRSSLMSVMVSIGGASAQVEYAGPAPGFVGLDQLNVRLARSLIGRGEVDVALAVDGQAANSVRINIR